MSKNQVATVVGLAACGLLAWSCYRLALSTGCDSGAYSCPTFGMVAMLALGLAVAIFATFFGAGVLVFAATFLAIGLGLGAGGLQVDSEARTALLILGVCFVLGGLLPAYLGTVGARGRRNQADLYAHGVPAIATVTGFRDTGATVNKNPMVELDLPTNLLLGRVEPADASLEVRHLFALAAAGSGGAGPGARSGAADPLDRLAKLNELRLAGALTEAEYEAQKAKLLGTS